MGAYRYRKTALGWNVYRVSDGQHLGEVARWAQGPLDALTRHRVVFWLAYPAGSVLPLVSACKPIRFDSRPKAAAALDALASRQQSTSFDTVRVSEHTPHCPVLLDHTPPGGAIMTSTITRPTVADILTKAADLLEEKGWCQNRAEDPDGHLCAIGALDAALGFAEPYINFCGLFSEAVSVLRDHVGAPVVPWNDAPGRTADEVITALRDTAEEAATAPTGA